MEPLSDAQFAAFMEGLDSEVRQEFFYTHGGNERQMRFVACIDKLILNGKGTIQDAYMMATGCSKDKAEKAAYDDYHHPAVQAIIMAIQHRGRLVEWAKIEVAWAKIVREQIERGMSEKATIKERELGVKAGYMFSQRVQQSEMAERNERIRTSLVRAKRASDAIIEVPTKEQVAALFKELLAHYDRDTLLSLVSEGAAPKQLN